MSDFDKRMEEYKKNLERDLKGIHDFEKELTKFWDKVKKDFGIEQ